MAIKDLGMHAMELEDDVLETVGGGRGIPTFGKPAEGTGVLKCRLCGKDIMTYYLDNDESRMYAETRLADHMKKNHL